MERQPRAAKFGGNTNAEVARFLEGVDVFHGEFANAVGFIGSCGKVGGQLASQGDHVFAVAHVLCAFLLLVSQNIVAVNNTLAHLLACRNERKGVGIRPFVWAKANLHRFALV